MRETRAARAINEWLESGSVRDPHTQGILAQRLSAQVNRPVSQSTVSQIARGQQQPRADLVAAFRVVLGIDVECWLPEKDSADALVAETPDSSSDVDSKPAA